MKIKRSLILMLSFMLFASLDIGSPLSKTDLHPDIDDRFDLIGSNDDPTGPSIIEDDPKGQQAPGYATSVTSGSESTDSPRKKVNELVQEGNDNYEKRAYKDAIDMYDEAITLISQPNELNEFIEISHLKDEPNESIEISRLKGNLANIFYDKGNALCALDKYKEAIVSYNLAIDMNPDFAEAWYNKGFALQELGLEVEANEAYSKAKDLGYTGP